MLMEASRLEFEEEQGTTLDTAKKRAVCVRGVRGSRVSFCGPRGSSPKTLSRQGCHACSRFGMNKKDRSKSRTVAKAASNGRRTYGG
ncbi:hypothetical protein KPH14_001462 [Odynerus spinipes]|uniref:Uncharacterized protein n=1 Tax=Odynerus spinipes TaxID=1348599 RepID=A0AAD9RV22_9HYME|nr:hypothetical protein KPH14_001462 [Odynerus spinipes]